MSDITGGPIGNKLWDDRAAIVAGERRVAAEKAFQRTRMAPAVSHTRTPEVDNFGSRKMRPAVSHRPAASGRRISKGRGK